MRETINEILIEILELDNANVELINREKNATWDSIKHLEIIMAIEEEFDIRFTATEVTAVKTIQDLYEYVEKKLV
ncbi:acyl carrier protein [Lysinibacillus sp. RSDA_15]|uniref:acyl carrier protein n=1 Tax=Lysinibacillus TaxID=400634 RepID=UPI0018CE5F7C|nr:acyl carrier protein [Lysinibacillus sphaericus]QTB14241.1 acyl carrier protein [Lysinibacillus sphaericus]